MVSPGASRYSISSPDNEIQAVPVPATFWRMNPFPPKSPAPKDC